MPVLAHLVSANSLPLPRWLLAYLLALVVLLVVAGVRASSPRVRWPEPDRRAEPRRRRAGPVIGAALYVATTAIALAAGGDNGYFATLLVIVGFWMGGLVVALLAGDWYAALDPFALAGALAHRARRGDQGSEDAEEDGGPPWTAAAMVAGFLWFWLAYGERVPTNLDTGLFLLVYAAAAVGGAASFGPRWLRTGEGFAATFALVGSLAPLGRDPATGRLALRSPVRGLAERGPVPGTAALAAVLLGGIGYEGLIVTSWWSDSIVGARTGGDRLLVATVGLAWTILIAHVGIAAAARGAARLADRDPAGLVERLGGAAAALALGAWVAYEIPQLVVDLQNLYALASDPLGRGSDLFGTIDHLPDPVLIPLRAQAWLGIAALAYATASAAVAAHEACFASFSPRRAARAEWAPAAVLAVGSAGAGLLLLGH